MATPNVGKPVLNWSQQDIEQRLLVPGGRFTKVNAIFSCVIAAVLTAAFFGILATPLLRHTYLDSVLTQRGPTQHAVIFLTLWCIVILIVKWSKLRYQYRSLELRVIPDELGFVLSTATVDRVIEQIHSYVDDPRHFVLLNRLVIALANLRNLGHVGDVDDILRSQATQDEAALDTSYSLLQGFVWAIPVLGFIGTVLGLSEAIGQFSGVLGASQDVSQLSSALKKVTAGLATAFDTTLVALIAALVIQLLMTFMRKSEEEFLDCVMEYGLRNVVGRLRIVRD